MSEPQPTEEKIHSPLRAQFEHFRKVEKFPLIQTFTIDNRALRPVHAGMLRIAADLRRAWNQEGLPQIREGHHNLLCLANAFASETAAVYSDGRISELNSATEEILDTIAETLPDEFSDRVKLIVNPDRFKFDDKFIKTPLDHYVRVIPSSGPTELRRTNNWANLFEDPEFSRKTARGHYVFSYLNRTVIPEEHLPSIVNDVTVTEEQLLSQQVGRRFISKDIYVTNDPIVTGHALTRMKQAGYRNIPDFDRPQTLPRGKEYTARIYEILATRFALRTALIPLIGEPIDNFDQMREIAESVGTPFDLDEFYEGLDSAIAQDKIEVLIERGMLPVEGVEEYLKRAADEMFRIKEYQFQTNFTGRRNPDASVIPFRTTINVVKTPSPTRRSTPIDVRFLPYAATNLLYFMNDLPELIQKGQSFDLTDMATTVNGLFTFSRERIAAAIQEDLGTSDITELNQLYEALDKTDPVKTQMYKRIHNDLALVGPAFQAFMKLYQREPTLLHKIGKIETPGEGAIPKAYEMRQQILRHGGRAPRKPFAFSIKHGTPKGEV